MFSQFISFPNVQDLREAHFGQEVVRQGLREVALLVTDRIHSRAFVPIGAVGKALENAKVKIKALQLPPRPADAAPPVRRLLDWAAAEDAANANGVAASSAAGAGNNSQ